jgi:hypothetical protein
MARAIFISIQILFLLTVFPINHLAYAQDDYKEWLKKDSEKLANFIKEDDKKFVEFLKKQWIEIGLQRQVPVYLKPKPTAIPVYIPDVEHQIENPVNDGIDLLKENEDECGRDYK